MRAGRYLAVLLFVLSPVDAEDFFRGGLPPQKAASVMTVPEGFRVKLVAGEPELHQPVAFAIDARGRLWVAEAHTYPQREGGHDGDWNDGKDRIVIFEDADADSSFETRKVFAENINLVSGLEVGFGGVWVGAAPYLLFFADTNGDDKPDGEPEVLLDGFGFHDTHETLNSFIWGPDGWLYGCHGVFTYSNVGKPGTPDEERTPLNAGYWRYHPTQRAFEVFAWGTSNPWGLDFNDHGQAFATACVIPHLYHVIQGARYQRQGGRHFNPHIYDDIKTIADHLHYTGNIRDHAWWGQTPQAPKSTLEAGGGHAHCGALVYLGDNFPAEYRNRLFVHNIHGNRVNTEILERRGSGYVGRHGPDLLLANNAWFRGIDLQCGPDGGVFLIDWYDKNACHRTQPLIWDRTNGRIYKVTYGETTPPKVDLAKLSNSALAALQLHENEWYVRNARRLLQERGVKAGSKAHATLLDILASQDDETRKLRALWALHVTTGINEKLALELLGYSEEYVRAWTVQCIVEDGRLTENELAKLTAMSRDDPSAVVRLYLASALQRLPQRAVLALAQGLIGHAEDNEDHNLPRLIWYGIEPIAARAPEHIDFLLASSRLPLVKRLVIRRMASNVDALEPLMSTLGQVATSTLQLLVLEEMRQAFKGHANLERPAGWDAVYEQLSQSSDAKVVEHANAIAVRFGDRRVFPHLRTLLADSRSPPEARLRALSVLRDGGDAEAVPIFQRLVSTPGLRGDAIRALARFSDPDTAPAILAHYLQLQEEEQRDALVTLSSRTSYGLALLEGVKSGRVPRKHVTAFTVRQLRTLRNETLDERIAEVWGTVRETSADKAALVNKYKELLNLERLGEANLSHGRALYQRLCSQCHRLFGSGTELAPDLTGSNRADLDYVLENLLDPSAVVGKDYEMEIVALRDGRVISGLVLGETQTAITIRQTSEEVVVSRRDLVTRQKSAASLMPDGLLADLKGAEVRDLMRYLASPQQVPMPGVEVEIDPKTQRVAGALEGETLELAKTRGDARPQTMTQYRSHRWSGNSHLWWTGGRPGDRLDIEIPVAKTDIYDLCVTLTQAKDYGIVQFSWDGRDIEAPVDCYHAQVVPSGTISLGRIHLDAGMHTLGVEILGANPKALKAYMFGLDYVLVRPAE